MGFFDSIFGSASEVSLTDAIKYHASNAFDYFTDWSMPDKTKMGDQIVYQGGEGAIGETAEFFGNNPAALTGIGYGAKAYIESKDAKKAREAAAELQRQSAAHDLDMLAKRDEYDKGLLEMKNDMENERYWVKPPSQSVTGNYARGWVQNASPIDEHRWESRYGYNRG